ncbi:MAG: DUF2442 domain-containing protein [Bacteroidales bacterium]|nr:DUF2442 domain-containing protein [Bacteroidales bacterium]
MKIVEEPSEVYGTEVIEIVSAEYIGDRAIRVKFDNGVEKCIDFKPFLLNSLHPSIRKYLDETLFKEFQIIDGNLNWNDYDLIFPIEDLLEGQI